MLDNPFMRKTVGRIASLGKVAMIGGMDVKKLIDGFAAEIRKQTNEAGMMSYDEGGPDEQEVRIETFKNMIKELLKKRGVKVEVLQEPRCMMFMMAFINENPELWFEDIGKAMP